MRTPIVYFVAWPGAQPSQISHETTPASNLHAPLPISHLAAPPNDKLSINPSQPIPLLGADAGSRGIQCFGDMLPANGHLLVCVLLPVPRTRALGLAALLHLCPP